MKRNEPCLLVVEDDTLIRLVLTETLQEAGYGVIEARNGLEALAAFAGEMRIDAIITDVDMPGGISGLDVARMVRINDRIIPIVIVSGQMRDPVAEGLQGVDFLQKPYYLQDVLDRVSIRFAERTVHEMTGPSKLIA